MLFIGDDALLAWIGARLPDKATPKELKPCVCVGVVLDDKVVAGVVYNNYRSENMELTIAADSPRWASRRTVGAILAIPFQTYGTRRITATTLRRHKRTRKFLERIGFVLEGRLRDASPKGDLLIYGMTKNEFLRSKWNVQKDAKSA